MVRLRFENWEGKWTKTKLSSYGGHQGRILTWKSWRGIPLPPMISLFDNCSLSKIWNGCFTTRFVKRHLDSACDGAHSFNDLHGKSFPLLRCSTLCWAYITFLVKLFARLQTCRWFVIQIPVQNWMRETHCISKASLFGILVSSLFSLSWSDF